MNERLLYDVEADNFIEKVTKLHCIAILNIDNGKISQYGPAPHDLKKGVDRLIAAAEVIGHNIIKYDNAVIEKLYGVKFVNKVTDTFVYSRLLYPNMMDLDMKRPRDVLPGKYIGSHGLEAWGYRLGVFKDEYTGGFEEWSQEMHDYNRQDVVATHALYLDVMLEPPPEKAVWIETRFAQVISKMEQNGFGFNEEAGWKLYADLVVERVKLEEELKASFPPKVITEIFVPKVNSPKFGYVKGQPFTKVHTIPFNPSSRLQIGERLKELGWQPTEFTPTGQPKVDEEILSSLPWPEAQVLARYFLIDKRIGQISEGEQAWLKLVKKGKIHGNVNTNGAVTGRCTHSNPNIAQVPKVGSPYGAECRALFGPRLGWVLVGADLSGLELRCLAHFMARYDNGEYGRILLTGDIHWANVRGAGWADVPRDDHLMLHKILRDFIKTFIYAFLYGAGDWKIGSIVNDLMLQLKSADIDPSFLNHFFKDTRSEKAKAKRAMDPFMVAGSKLRKTVLTKIPALGKLVKAVQDKVNVSGFLLGLDGRKLHIRSSHAALNTLLQSAGALISKVATIYIYDELSTRGYVHGKDWAFCAHVHDEVQIECKPGIADEVGRVAVEAFGRAGEYFDFRIPIDGEWKKGANWRDTH
jgi:DNA polymerase-1